MGISVWAALLLLQERVKWMDGDAGSSSMRRWWQAWSPWLPTGWRRKRPNYHFATNCRQQHGVCSGHMQFSGSPPLNNSRSPFQENWPFESYITFFFVLIASVSACFCLSLLHSFDVHPWIATFSLSLYMNYLDGWRLSLSFQTLSNCKASWVISNLWCICVSY